MSDIAGFCPMGCGWTLISDEDGDVGCVSPTCPRPTAVAEILADEETEHVVTFSLTAFTVRHPLRERLDDALMECQLHEHIAALSGPPVPPGRYRAVPQYGVWTWAEVTQ